MRWVLHDRPKQLPVHGQLVPSAAPVPPTSESRSTLCWPVTYLVSSTASVSDGQGPLRESHLKRCVMWVCG